MNKKMKREVNFSAAMVVTVTKNDIDLAEHVRKRPSLYDKSQKEFKIKQMNSLMWITIATSLDLKSGKERTNKDDLCNLYPKFSGTGTASGIPEPLKDFVSLFTS